MTIDLEALYIDLHQHPELGNREFRTASLVAEHLRALGFDEVKTGVAHTGVVGVLRGGLPGDVVALRADMDALPVAELTGLPYASTARGIDPAGNDVPVMHACGHDMHVTAMIGAVEKLVAEKDDWSGTVVVLIQPAEEYGAGSRAMLDAHLRMSNAAFCIAISACAAISGSTGRIEPSAMPSLIVPAKRRAIRFERSTIASRACDGRPESAVVRNSGPRSENWTSSSVAIVPERRSQWLPPRSSARCCASVCPLACR